MLNVECSHRLLIFNPLAAGESSCQVAAAGTTPCSPLIMSQERLKILLIEHDAGFTNSVREMLNHGSDPAAEIVSAPGLHPAFEELKKNTYHVVILDVSVPDGAG